MRSNILRRIIAAVLVCTLLTGQFLISGAYAADEFLLFDENGDLITATESVETEPEETEEETEPEETEEETEPEETEEETEPEETAEETEPEETEEETEPEETEEETEPEETEAETEPEETEEETKPEETGEGLAGEGAIMQPMMFASRIMLTSGEEVQNNSAFRVTVSGSNQKLHHGDEVSVTVSIEDDNLTDVPNLTGDSIITVNLPEFFEFTEADKNKLLTDFGNWFERIDGPNADNQLILDIKAGNKGGKWAHMNFSIKGIVNTIGYEGDGSETVTVAVGGTGTNDNPVVPDIGMNVENGIGTGEDIQPPGEDETISYYVNKTIVSNIDGENVMTHQSDPITYSLEFSGMRNGSVLELYDNLSEGNLVLCNSQGTAAGVNGVGINNCIRLYMAHTVEGERVTELCSGTGNGETATYEDTPLGTVTISKSGAGFTVHCSNVGEEDEDRDIVTVSVLYYAKFNENTNADLANNEVTLSVDDAVKNSSSALIRKYRGEAMLLSKEVEGGTYKEVDADGEEVTFTLIITQYGTGTYKINANDFIAEDDLDTEHFTYLRADDAKIAQTPFKLEYDNDSGFIKVLKRENGVIPQGVYELPFTVSVKNLAPGQVAYNTFANTVKVRRMAELTITKNWEMNGGDYYSLGTGATIGLYKDNIDNNGDGHPDGTPIATATFTADRSETLKLTADQVRNDQDGIFYLHERVDENCAYKSAEDVKLTIKVENDVIKISGDGINTVSDGEAEVTFFNEYDETETGSIHFTKTDGKRTITQSDGTYTLYRTIDYDPDAYSPEWTHEDLQGTPVENYIEVSTSNGTYTFTDLPYKDDSGKIFYYYIAEDTAPNGYVKTGKTTRPVSLNNNTNTVNVSLSNDIFDDGTITIEKKDTEGNVLKGITFTLYDKNKQEIKSSETNNYGVVSFEKLIPGMYYVKETLPDKYTGYTGFLPIVISYNGEVVNAEANVKNNTDAELVRPEGTKITLYWENSEEFGSLTIQKLGRDIAGVTTPLAGVGFELRGSNGDTVVTQTTGQDGKLTFSNLPFGDYKLYEVEPAADGYQIPESLSVNGSGQSIEISRQKQNEEITVYNDTKRVKVKVLKTDADDSNVKLVGAQFGLFSAADCNNSSLLEAGFTGEDGVLIFQKELEKGTTYYVKEIQPPTGYQLNSAIETVSVTSENENEEFLTFSFTNEKRPYRIQLVKKDDLGNPLADVTFKLTGTMIDGNPVTSQADGETVEYMLGTSDDAGVVVFDDLAYGDYTIVESDVPSGYCLDTTPITVRINAESEQSNTGTVTITKGQIGGATKDLIIENKHTKLIVEKYQEGTTIRLPGAKFQIKNGDDLVKATGEAGVYYYSPNGSVDTFETDANGQFTLEYLPVSGGYQLFELKAPHGYMPPSTEPVATFTISSEPDDVPYVVPVYNILVESNLKLVKKDSNGKLLPDVGFKLKSQDKWVEVSGSNGNYEYVGLTDADVTEMVTNGNGEIFVEGLQWNLYYLHETRTPAGLSGLKEPVQIPVDDGTHGTTIIRESEIENQILYGSIFFTKVDSDNNPLAGAVFKLELLEDLNNPYALDYKDDYRYATSDTSGRVEFKYIPYGLYKLTEYQPAHGFESSDDVYYICVGMDTSAIKGTYDNDKLYSSDGFNSEQIRWPNEKTHYAIVIFKQDIYTKEHLNGATFEVTGKNFHTTATIEENGYVIVEVPALGEYSVVEVGAPSGYSIDPEPMTVQVTKHIPRKEIEYAIQNNTLYHTATVTSKDYPTVVTLHKYHQNGDEKVTLTGAEFEIWDGDSILTFSKDPDTGEYTYDVSGTLTTLTSDTGFITIYRIPLGTYTVVETKAPDAYMNLGSVKLVVNGTGENVNELGIENIPYQRGVAVCKEDEQGIRLAGANFKLYSKNDESENLVKTTTASGYAFFMDLKAGTYYLKEITAPTGYVLDDTNYWFKIDGNGTLTAIDRLGEPTDAYVFENRGTTENPLYVLTVVNKSLEHTLRVMKASSTAANKQPLSGAQFRILGNGIHQTYTTNENGCVDISLPVGEYMLTEIKAPHGYVMDLESHAVKVTPNGITIDTDQDLQYDDQTQTYSFSVVNEPEEFLLAINKVDAETGVGLSGAVFTVTSSKDSSVKYHMGTDADGITDSVSLKPGKYAITEIDAPNGYNVPLSGWSVTVEEGGMGNVTFEGVGIEKHSYQDGLLTLSITNQRTSGNLVITKHDAQDKSIVLKDARFRLYDAAGNVIFTTGADGKFQVVHSSVSGATNSFRTGSDGKAILENLPFGEYKLYELDAPVGYQIMPERFITVKMTTQDENVQIYVPNERLLQKVTVIKEDETGMKLTGAVFTLYRVNTDGSLEVLGEDTTGTDGIAEFTVPYGSYEIWETKAPDGYEKCATPVSFAFNAESSENESFTYNVKNVKSTYSIQVYKYHDGEPDTGLAGAEFAFTNSLGFTKVITTDANGIAMLEDAQYDDYTIREITAPDGYYLHDHEYEVKRTDLKHGEPVEIKVPNEFILGSIWLRKLDYHDHDRILNAEFVIYDEQDNPLKWTETEAGYVLDSNGNERIHAGNVKLENIPAGQYRLEEVKAPDGYLVLENDYEFSITAENAKAGIVHEIMNLKRMSAFGVCKVDADDISIRLSGAEFTLYAMENGVQGEAIDTLITDARGWAIFTELTMGTYRIVETKAPFGYEKTSDSVVNFRITEDGTIEVFRNNDWSPVPEGTRTIGVRNKSIVQKITLKKVAENTNKLLEGAVFQLTGKDVSVRLVTNKDGIAEVTLPYGEYVLWEIIAPDGYLLDRNPHKLQISETELKLDSKSVKDFTFVLYNHPVQIPVILHKEDAESGKSLSGAKFTISGNGMKFTVTSGNKGNTDRIYLTPGKYTVSETVTPNGYRKPVYGWILTVDNHGRVHVSGGHSVVALVDHVPTITIGNEKISASGGNGSSSGGGGGSSIAKTGEVFNRNMFLSGIIMSSISSVGLAVLFLDEVRRRRRAI